MQNVILSPIEIPALINLIASEIEARLLTREQATPAASAPIKLIGDKAAAAYLGCSKLTVSNLRKAGTIPFYRYGRKNYFWSNELDQELKVSARKFHKKPV